MSNEDYETIKRIATTKYLKRMAGGLLVDPPESKDYESNFNFDFIDDLPVSTSLDFEGQAADWEMFLEIFGEQWALHMEED